MRPTGTSSQLEQRRRRAVALLEQGWATADVAAKVGTTSRSVNRWWIAYCEQGQTGLEAQPHPGKPCRLSPRQRDWLTRRLLKGAKANGYPTDLWTCVRIAEVIERHYGVHYHVDHIPRLMASLGWSCQKPERRAVERDEAAIERWVLKDWSRIKKRRKP